MKKQILTMLLLSVVTAAGAADLPKRKSGLWEITPTSSSAKGRDISMTLCVDASSDQDMSQQFKPMGQVKCSKQEQKVDGKRITFNSVCDIGKTTATTTGVASGDFDKEYKVETKSTYNPPLGTVKESTNVITAKWLGPCKAGQRPGDVVMSNGMTMNMNDMMKMQKK